MSDGSQKEKLRQHFARRVTTQARVVLDTWQKIHTSNDSFTAHRDELLFASDKLVRYAQRFEMEGHAEAGRTILGIIRDWPANTSLDDATERQLQDAIDALARSTLRRTDQTYTHGNTVEPYRVLVLDDSRAQAKFMETVLKKAGMTAHIITDPMEIIDALDMFSPEIIILDMYMPGCTGMEIARVIRQQDRFHSVPIIYLSAEDDVTKQLHAMSLGGDDFLTKPIDPKHLISTLHNRGRRARSLLALMIRDSLTGLYNHTHTLYLLDQEIVRARQKDQSLCFAMIDIDYFKKVNDAFGHPIGDRVLRSLSMFLKQRLRKTDHVGRYGGEEFAIILPDTRPSDARNVLNEIRERFSELQQPAGDREFNVTFSCGIASWNNESSQTLCERADRSLYTSKEHGRNCVTLADN